jgi:hypothetical protein
MPFLFSAHVKSKPGSCHKRGWFCAGCGRTSAGASTSVRNDRENKIGRWCVRTIAGMGEIVVGLTGNYLGILAHPAGAPLILALCRSNGTDSGSDTCSFSEAMALKMPARHCGDASARLSRRR